MSIKVLYKLVIINKLKTQKKKDCINVLPLIKKNIYKLYLISMFLNINLHKFNLLKKLLLKFV